MLLVVALAVVSGGVAGWWLSPSQPQPAAVPMAATVATASNTVAVAPVSAAPAPGPVARSAPAAVPSAPSAPAAPVRPQRDPGGDQTPDLADYLNTGEHPPMAEVIDRLHAAGVHTGLGAFSPPGTRPPLVGLVVPEDFVLPDGYVRHHQVTDDGERIEPILMFAPGRQFVDAAGQPIAVPADRVVPPELAPAGLPIRRVTIPAPADPSRVRS
ncbi:hypothetical protein ACPWT1_05765 [Ramlibacter sp. MMS24-I3-19]|uniref:hypothetical protein n=1 Tax=Ramlibacter sp. MMS24-I3-19 TaxID=3416606 RepID=UPI003D06B5DB